MAFFDPHWEHWATLGPVVVIKTSFGETRAVSRIVHYSSTSLHSLLRAGNDGAVALRSVSADVRSQPALRTTLAAIDETFLLCGL